jgi:competence protein ComEA
MPLRPQTPARASGSGAASVEAPVDINHASVEELIRVPGLTRSWAERIVRFRPYRTKLDLVQDGVMPFDVYSRIKDYIIAHHDKK